MNEQFDDAVTFLAEGVEWRAVDGSLRYGRTGCLQLFQEQKQAQMKRSQCSSWVVLPLSLKDVEIEEDSDKDEEERIVDTDKTYVAQRTMMITSNHGSYPVTQTVRVCNGMIVRVAVVRDPIPWEPGLPPVEVLFRFAVLRSTDDDAAALCLHEAVEWHRFDMPNIFDAKGYPQFSDLIIRGRSEVRALWQKQKDEGISRSVKETWKPSQDGSYQRVLEIKNKNAYSTFKQHARCAGGYIVNIKHELLISL